MALSSLLTDTSPRAFDTSPDVVMILSKLSCSSSTHFPALVTVPIISLTRVWMFLAEAELLFERLLTSFATTAKPRPCSPARAASTAAFIESRFVWNVISLISSIISTIFWLASDISTIAWAVFRTISPPSLAVETASLDRESAWRVVSRFSEVFWTSSRRVLLISSMAAACCWVRSERFWFALDICITPFVTGTVFFLTFDISETTLSSVSLRPSVKRSIMSFLPEADALLVKSPWLTLSSTSESSLACSCITVFASSSFT